MRRWRRRLQARLLLWLNGLPQAALRGGLDRTYREYLLEWIRTSSLDAAVVFAQDWPHTTDGQALPGQAAFYTPNDAVLALAAEYPDCVIPAVSIHPARKDALAELERCLMAGARILKLLPNVHGVDCRDPGHRPFWKRLAEARGILIAHTGAELALPVVNRAWESPEYLDGPLNCGVTVIAAHCGGGYPPLTKDYTDVWIRMLATYPHLYGDISALVLPDRIHTLKKVLDPVIKQHLLHGSDFPIPSGPLGPWSRRMISTATALRLRRISNPLERDYQIKRTLGFDDAVFHRFWQLLR